MSCVIRIRGLEGSFTIGDNVEGSYVKWYDPDAFGGRGDMKATTKIEEAKKEHDQFVQKLQEKGIKAKITDSGIEIEQALASATTNQTTAPIENIVKPLSDLKEMAAKAFADSVTIGGRKLETLKKK